MIISLIVAQDSKGGIGKNNKLPWHLHSDLVRFKKITMGHHIIMGRQTYETIGKQLPGRVMIIVTHNEKYTAQGCIVVHSLKEAIKFAEQNKETEAFIIGGGQLFAQSISFADRIYLTDVCANIDADVFFPEIDDKSWETVLHQAHPQDEKDDYSTEFKILARIHKLED